MTKKETALAKLNSLAKPDPGNWKKDVQWRKDNKAWLRKSQKIAFLILRALRAQKKTQKDLAILLDVSPQQVNKWVKGKENFTLATLCALEEALGITLLKPEQKPSVAVAVASHSFFTTYERTTPIVEKIQTAEGGPKVIKLQPSEYTTPKQTG